MVKRALLTVLVLAAASFAFDASAAEAQNNPIIEVPSVETRWSSTA